MAYAMRYPAIRVVVYRVYQHGLDSHYDPDAIYVDQLPGNVNSKTPGRIVVSKIIIGRGNPVTTAIYRSHTYHYPTVASVARLDRLFHK
mgnify:CR=1 FL=1